MTIGIAVFNQKCGASKTIATVNLAAAFASQGASVLVCDLDGQASLSAAVGLDEAIYTDPDQSIYTFLITKQGDPNRMILPARIQHTYMRRFDRLMEQIDDLEDEYDVRIGLIGVVPVAYLGYPDERAYLEALKTEMPGGVAPELRWRDTAIEEARTQGHSVFSYKPSKKHREESLRKCRDEYLLVTQYVRERTREGIA